MNWLVFAVIAWFAIGLEAGFAGALGVQIGPARLVPSFVVPLAVYIAMSAAPTPALWCSLVLGLMLDLTTPAAESRAAQTVIGPYALGLFVTAQYVLAIRGLMIRRNPLSIVFLAVTGSALMHLVVVAIFTARRIYGGMEAWNAGHELVERLGSSLYTGATALILGFLLQLVPLGFHGAGSAARAIPRRAYERR